MASMHITLAAAVVLLVWASDCTAEHQETFTVQYKDGMREQAVQDAVSKGYDVVREYPRFDRLVIAAASTVATAAAAAAAGDASVQIAALLTPSTVAAVEPNGFIKAPRPVPDYDVPVSAAAGTPRDPREAAEQSAPTPPFGRAAPQQCSLFDPNNPDAGLGLNGEGVPYGITFVQADMPEMKEIAAKYQDKVLWCVIDTGLDIKNQEFDREKTSGCIGPGNSGNTTTRDSFKYCYNWYDDQHGHGTHTSGTIAALRNGRGVVGVAPEGAHLYHYNFFGPNEQEPVDLTVATWLECIDELDRRKVSTGNPDMKLVISMSFGVDYPNTFAQTAIKTLAAERQDVLWLASAGNSGDATMGCPACYPEVMSVAAVDWTGRVAGFSTRNAQVDIAAPGVKTVSTVPLANTAGSDYYFAGSKNILTTSPAVPLLNSTPDFFSRPPVGSVSGAPSGTVTGELVDCGLASSGTCPGAEGKACLIQRGETSFCSKIAACATSGGIAAVLYNGADKPACERFSGVDVTACPDAPTSWPVSVTVSRRQGEALKAAVVTAAANGAPLSITLDVPEVAAQKEIGLAAYSGTSMACPTAAGVAGLVWSAHTDCSSSEIRNALEQSAKKPAAAPDKPWTPEYGHGIIQALAAHQYLQQHPCQGSGQVDIAMTHDVVSVSWHRDSDAAASKVRRAGSVRFVDVKIAVKYAGTETPVAGQAVRLTVRPGPEGTTLACQKYVLTTDVTGVANAKCQLAQGSSTGSSSSSSSKAVLVARVPEAPGFKEAFKVYEIEVN